MMCKVEKLIGCNLTSILGKNLGLSEKNAVIQKLKYLKNCPKITKKV